jgi:predicted nucleotidyltransferase
VKEHVRTNCVKVIVDGAAVTVDDPETLVTLSVELRAAAPGAPGMLPEGLRRIEGAHAFLDINVFGSVARGEARPDSDLDLLVGFEPSASLLDHVGLVQGLEELLGLEGDVATRNALKPRDELVCAEAIDL